METEEDWFTRVDRAANEYFAKPDSKPECFVRIYPPPFVGAKPNPEEPRTYRVQYDLNGESRHRIELWDAGAPVRTGEKHG